MCKLKGTNKIFVLTFIIIILLCLAGITVLKQNKPQKPVAYIYSHSKLVKTIDLSNVKKDFTIEFSGNTVLVQNNKISVIEATCPDKLCVKQGAVYDSSKSIICLPHQLEIKIIDSKKSNKIDAITH